MTDAHGFACRACGEWHTELPLSFHALAPDAWLPDLAHDGVSVLGGEQCIIRNELFFVRGLIRMHVTGADEHFEWGVWVEVSESHFDRMTEQWEIDGRERGPAVPGSLANALPVYPQLTHGLEVAVHTQPVGLRPLVEVVSADHLLAGEQRDGIDQRRVQEIAERVLHGT